MSALDRIINSIHPLAEDAMEQACQRQAMLTKPRGSLGLLEALSIQLAGIQSNPFHVIHQKAVITMAADHGVVNEGISLYP
ncbi:MAG: nicotinate-nucleotide--dimethylbenzimidazole phosphoribosyltransferase, partial [Chloroflexi bacterium]|nr:nicotinate-nucleotide--dimethylbenzimidazole phosphoribosyltransferase [Chloroflexota bacterium]